MDATPGHIYFWILPAGSLSSVILVYMMSVCLELTLHPISVKKCNSSVVRYHIMENVLKSLKLSEWGSCEFSLKQLNMKLYNPFVWLSPKMYKVCIYTLSHIKRPMWGSGRGGGMKLRIYLVRYAPHMFLLYLCYLRGTRCLLALIKPWTSACSFFVRDRFRIVFECSPWYKW